MKKYSFFYFLLMVYGCVVIPASAQRCVTTQMEELNNIRHPEWKQSRQRFEQKVLDYARRNKPASQQRTSSGAATYTIPVVVHVIHNVSSGAITGKNIPDQQIYDQIAVLNEDYRRNNSDSSNTPAIYKSVAADVQIEFCLAVRDPNGDPTNGILRVYNSQSQFDYYSDDIYLKSLSYWPSDEYLNIWVCDLANGVLGYAQFPSDNTDNNGPAETDGVVIDYSTFGKYVTTSAKYNLGRTTTHEVGHWLDLIHIWGDMADCSGNDFCDDIPPCSDTYYSSKDNCFAPLQCGFTRMIQNYMDYSDDACMNLFTGDQKTRMHSAMQVSPRRIAIQSSLGCCNTCYVPHTAFTASKTQDVKINEVITFTNQCTGSIDTYKWNFGAGAVPATATGPGPFNVYYTSSGYKNVTLVASGGYGIDSVTKNNYIFVQESPPEPDFYANKTSGIIKDEVITFTNNSLGDISNYAWDFGQDAVPPTATGPGPFTVSYSSIGLKTVSLTASNSETSVTNTKTYYISVVSQDQTEVHIYPNPAQVAVSIGMEFKDPTKVQLFIYDRLGKKVFDHETFDAVLYNEVVNVEAWADGMYLIKVIANDQTVSTWRLLVIK